MLFVGGETLMDQRLVQKLKKYLRPGKRVHLVGIGGVSMRPLGLVLKGMGLEVTGSDMNSSVSTDELIAQGIRVHIGHRAENVGGADCVIRTAAVHNDNPEIAAARAAGIPVFERAQAWGVIMQAYKNAVCISGTHGKTTTTSMVTHILMEAQTDPTVMIGGYLPLIHAGHRVGNGDTIVLESCEYCDSFLNFFPTLADSKMLFFLDFSIGFCRWSKICYSGTKYSTICSREIAKSRFVHFLRRSDVNSCNIWMTRL